MRFIKHIYASFSFHTIRFVSYHPKAMGKNLYITFDDGPESGITEFVLDELNKYGAKATFFCCGKNCEVNSNLYQRILNEGHAVGNHTYNHICGIDTPIDKYVEDAEHCFRITKTYLFRPPWGQLTFSQYFKLRKKYSLIYWDLSSGDTEKNIDQLAIYPSQWDKTVKNGDIILFHFCHRHEKSTKILLPVFLKLMSEKGYQFRAIKKEK